jgi:L-2-amino-thiazoline-4-carboxylic acid hydrolase
LNATVLERTKIQAQVLVPLVKALQAELGEARANALVRRTLGDLYRGFSEEFARARNEKAKNEKAGNEEARDETDLGKFVASAFRTYARGDALEYDILEQTPDAFAIDIRRCRYAEFYKALGEPELGFLLVCTADFAVADGFGDDVKLTRTQTIMQGADRCDFRYRRAKAD